MDNIDLTTNYEAIILEQNKEIAGLKAAFEEVSALLEYYKEQLRLAKHRKFGVSSEKSNNPDQSRPIQLV